MHTHTENSHDSNQTIDELCISAIEGGVSGFAVTEHPSDIGPYSNIKDSMRDVEYARKKYGGMIKILSGVELDDMIVDKNIPMLMKMYDYDVLLGSCHCFVNPRTGKRMPYSLIDFSDFTPDELDTVFGEYIGELEEISGLEGFDVLCHMTCPLRYFNGKYKKNFDISPYSDAIDRILKNVIKTNKALELNISGLFSGWNTTMPDADILHRYHTLGGRLVTIASDSHVPDHMGEKFDLAAEILRNAGFSSYYYFQKRSPVEITL